MKAQLIDIALTGKRTIQIKKVNKFFLDSPFHFHHLCELVWIEESFGKRIVGDNIDNFESGDLILMSPGLPHIWQNDPCFIRREKGFRAKATVIYFPPDFLLNLSDEISVIQPTQKLIKNAARGLRFYGATQNSVSKILCSISEKNGLIKILDFLHVIEILSQAKEFDYLASVNYKNMHDEKDAERINLVYKFLMQNFQRDISLQEVAGIGNMSATAFCRFFKSRTQKSFTQFLNELRIGHACKLLQNENYSVANVCYESGYNSLANFNKFFKVVTDKTPSKYRAHFKIVHGNI